ncbi:MAG: hypothetical protein LBS74_00200 [Oscillospiraceae bacterium]|jgi:hypothetical protein|nr:hypothetical protein [Oscillospiraceae bacterium]
MKKFTLPIYAILFVLFFSACNGSNASRDKYGTYQKEIDIIYVAHSGFGQTLREHKIDLQNKQYFEYTAEIGEGYVPRDASAENEGFTFLSNLEEDKIAAFIRSSARYGFTNWKEAYNNYNVDDGDQWEIKILFADGTQKTITGSNAYPKTWNNMYKAFEDLTGENILLLKSGWLHN